MNRKAQIQIGETIAVLFVFFMLIVIGFLFYAKVIKGSIESEKEEASQFRSIGIAQKVMFLPELQCSEDNIIIDNCIDSLKLDAAEKLMRENKVYYYDLFEFSDVDVQQIYPSHREWHVYSRTMYDFRTKYLTNVPIALYNPDTKRHSFGVLTIETRLK